MNCDCSADAGLSASKASSLNEHGFDQSAGGWGDVPTSTDRAQKGYI